MRQRFSISLLLIYILTAVCLFEETGLHTAVDNSPRCKIVSLERGRSRLVNINDNVTLVCHNLSDAPFQKIVWLQRKPVSGRIRVLNRFSGKSRLVISKVKRRHAGTYYCKVNDVSDCSYNLLVNTKPKIFRCSATPMKLIINESVIISCRVKSWPPPSTKWVLEQDQKLKEFKGVTQHKDNQVISQLNILRMSSEFEGTYTFIAENKFGKRTRKVQVDLLPPPVSKGVPNIKTVSPNATLTQLGRNSTLRCHVTNAFSVDAIPIWLFHQNCSENITNYRELILPREIWEGSQANIELHLVNISQAHLGCYKCCIRELQDDWLADEALVQRCQTLLIRYRHYAKRQYKTPWLHWIIVVSTTLAFLLLTVLFTCIKRRKHKTQASLMDRKTAKFDVFVSYNSRDFDWVQRKLLSFLDNHGVKYCIHSRDFEVGKTVVANMIDSVYTSKQVIAVISRNYMASSFCREELSIAVGKIQEENNNSLFLIRIDDINCKTLPKLLRKKTFLDYNDDEGKKAWKQRLLDHMTPNCSELSHTTNTTKIMNDLNSRLSRTQVDTDSQTDKQKQADR